MATLLQWYELRFSNPEFRHRLAAAIARLAYAILAEDPATPNHAQRLAVAHDVMQADVLAYADKYASYIMAADELVTAAATGQLADADLVKVLAEQFNAFASLVVPARPDLSTPAPPDLAGATAEVKTYVEALRAVVGQATAYIAVLEKVIQPIVP